MRESIPCVGPARTILVVLAVCSAIAACAAAPPRVTLAGGPGVPAVPVEDAARVAHSLERLLASCSVESTEWAGSEEVWSQALAGPHLRAASAAGREVDAMGRLVTWNEILLPLPAREWPAHVFVREELSIRAFTKYTPERLAELMFDDALGLEAQPQCEWLCENLRRALARAEKPAFKGMELYSWLPAGKDWHFSLLPGTNRLKSVPEIKAEETAIAGSDDLKVRLARLAEGESVFWQHLAEESFPEGMAQDLQAYCDGLRVKLARITRQSPAAATPPRGAAPSD